MKVPGVKAKGRFLIRVDWWCMGCGVHKLFQPHRARRQRYCTKACARHYEKLENLPHYE